MKKCNFINQTQGSCDSLLTQTAFQNANEGCVINHDEDVNNKKMNALTMELATIETRAMARNKKDVEYNLSLGEFNCKPSTSHLFEMR